LCPAAWRYIDEIGEAAWRDQVRSESEAKSVKLDGAWSKLRGSQDEAQMRWSFSADPDLVWAIPVRKGRLCPNADSGWLGRRVELQ
jgi:hypothetical protein